MGGSVIPVAVGQQATQLSGATPDNYTIYNTDSKNAIWLSNRNSVTPNNGMRLGPLGTSHWAKESGLAFACVDTGVTSPVSVNVSNDITDITNPVDVATATAAALLAQGVPNVLVTTTLVQQIINPLGNIVIDVSGQASIRLTMLAQAAGNAVLELIPFIPGGISMAFYVTAPDDGSSQALGAWEIPVSDFTSLEILSLAANPPIQVEVIGSNRVISQHRQLGNNYAPRQFAVNANFVAGVPLNFLVNDGVSDKSSRYNGPVKLHIQCANAAAVNAAGFNINMRYAAGPSAGAGALYSGTVLPLITTNSMIDWYHPPVPIWWQLYPNFTVANASVLLTVVPAGGGF